MDPVLFLLRLNNKESVNMTLRTWECLACYMDIRVARAVALSGFQERVNGNVQPTFCLLVLVPVFVK